VLSFCKPDNPHNQRLLVYLLVTLTFKSDRLKSSCIAGSAGWIALFASALFTVHPVETQAVTYTVQRLTSLATLFYLASLVFYIKARSSLVREGADRGAVFGFYLLSLVFAVMAMKTKEIALTLPVIALLYEFFFFEGQTRKRLLFISPMLVTFLVIPVSMVGLHEPVGHLMSDVNKITAPSDIPRWDYLLTQFSVVVTYIRLLFFPINQNLDYDYPISHSLFEPRVLVSLFILSCMLGTAVYLFIRQRKGGDAALRLVSFGILWFFVTLLVESSIIPIDDVIFEHRVYLPSIGVFIAVSCAGTMALRRWFAGTKTAIFAMAAVVVLLSDTTYARNMVWADAITLWRDTVKKSPGKVRPHNNLGVSYYHNGMLDESIEEYQTVIRLDPGNVEVYYNLGNSFLNKGMPEKAIEGYRTALKLNPDNIDAQYNMGMAYSKMGMLDKAREEFKTTLKLDPDYSDARYNLGVSYFQLDMLDEAIEEFKATIKLNPDYADAHYNLGISYIKIGMLDKSIEEFNAMLQLNPDDYDAHYNLGIALARKGLMEESRKELEYASRLKPDAPNLR
jgi:tetratricopeptide (TPR) repeat protein